MSKFTFKEYYESKKSLLKAADSVPRVNSEYELKKYCKFPVVAESEDKEYISLKPKDRINILWEYVTGGDPIATKVEIITEDEEAIRVSPCWGKSKLITWIQKNTIETN